MLGKSKSRILYMWCSRPFVGIFMYRLERTFFMIFGKAYPFIRVLFLPVLYLMQAYSNFDLHYKADIKGGILVLHCSNGVVVAGGAIIGSNLTLTGGNIIGITKRFKIGDFVVGDNCSLGANAVIIGPLQLGSNVKIGASACVTKSFTDSNITLVGVPAKIIGKSWID